MERFEELLDYINELNSDGRIRYDDYSRLFDLASEIGDIAYALDSAKTDIAALIWLNGNCEYCAHGEKEEFCGANRWRCKLGDKTDCKPEWRGASNMVRTIQRVERVEKPTSPREKLSRTERLFGPKANWSIHDEPATTMEHEEYKGFLLIECANCGKLHGFCAKHPISQYQCRDCDGVTQLHDLVSAIIRCKCGKRFKYRTNLEGVTFTYSCLSCGAPVDLAYNAKAREYQTVQ